MNCDHCDIKFHTNQHYITHLHIFHDIRNNFTCPINNCHRTFHKKYVFKQHLLKHNFNSNSVYIVHINQEVGNSANCSENITTQNSIDNPDFLTNSDKREEKVFNVIEEERLFNSILTDAAQIFISKLYNASTLSKSQIQNIINLVSNYLTCSVFNIIERFLENLICANEELLLVIKSMINNLKSFQ